MSVTTGSACGIGLPTDAAPQVHAQAAAAPEPELSRTRQWVEGAFGIDLRSLALFRVAMATLVLCDIVNRLTNLRAHYTNDGIIPVYALRALGHTTFNNINSFHAFSGSAWWQVLLFGIQAVIAVLLLVGWRTTLMTFLSWVMLISLHNRNLVVLQAGDTLFRVLFFWGLFLPLGAKWSIDAAMDSRPAEARAGQRKRLLTIATAAILVQVGIVYVTSAFFKWHPIWLSGKAVWYALQLDGFATPFAMWLREKPELLKPMCWYTHLLEGIGPFLALALIGPGRLVMVLLFIGMHVGFMVCMKLGLFAWISITSWLVFVPSWFWDKLFAWMRTPEREALRIYYDGECGFCQKMIRLLQTFILLPGTRVETAQSDPARLAELQEHNSWVVVGADGKSRYGFDGLIYVFRMSPIGRFVAPVLALFRGWGERKYRRVAADRARASARFAFLRPRPLDLRLPLGVSIICGFFFFYVVMWNVGTLSDHMVSGLKKANMPAAAKLVPRIEKKVKSYKIDRIASIFRINQQWNMFAPFPRTADGWYVIVGNLKNGETVDLFKGGAPLTWDKPALVSATYPNQRWRKYLMNVSSSKFKKHRPYYASYVFRDWNRTHEGDQECESLEVFWVQEKTEDGTIGPPTPISLAVYPTKAPR